MRYIIPLGSWNIQIIGGTCPQEIARHLDDKKYGRGQFIENRFPVLKKKFSENPEARRLLSPIKEITTSIVVCNIQTS